MTNNDNRYKEALDYEKLKDTALRYIQKIGHKHWTDFNLHDPGVTFLEAICFSLSDLAYRTEFSVADLLTPEDHHHPELSGALYASEQILSSNPVNVDEYRKLILEYVPGVRNVWIEPACQPYDIPQDYKEVFQNLSIEVNGFYKIRIERESYAYIEKKILANDELCRKIGLSEEGETAEARKARFNSDSFDEWLCGYASRLLDRHRNLNEGFLDVKILKPKDIKIQFNLVTASDEYETIVSEMYEKLDAYISPKVQLHSLQNLMDKGLTQEEIYQGYFGEEEGYVRYGLVDMEELRSSQRRMMLRSSDIYRLLMECIDVEDVTGIEFVGGQKADTLGHVVNSDSESCFRLVPFKFSRKNSSVGEDLNRESKRNDKVMNYLLKTQNPIVERTLISLDKGKVRMVTVDTTKENNKILLCHKSRKFEAPLVMEETIDEEKLGKAEISYPLPQGRYRNTKEYFSFQNLLPKLYKMGFEGVSKNRDGRYDVNRLQLKGYLTFFDQFLANYLMQLRNLKDYFAIKNANELVPMLQHSDLLSEENKGKIADVEKVLKPLDKKVFWQSEEYVLEQKNRLMDNLLAMFNDDFDELVPLVNMNDHDRFDGREYLEASVNDKARLLNEYVSLNQNRTVAIGRTGKLELSGVELRILKKLGVDSPKAKIGPYLDQKVELEEDGLPNLSKEFEQKFGIHVLEHLLLLPKMGVDRQSFLELTSIVDKKPIEDPYSFYVTVLYPGELNLFSDEYHHGDFRDYVRKVIRDELPAHIDAIILGISNKKMKAFEKVYEKYLDHLAHPEQTEEWLLLQRMHILRIREILMGLVDVNGDRNQVSFGIQRPGHRVENRYYYTSQASWKGIYLKDMLRSIERIDVVDTLAQKREEEKLINLIKKMLDNTLNDDDMLDLIWHVLNDHEDMMREFEELLNDPNTHTALWQDKLKHLANQINFILTECKDEHDDECKNNVIWGIQGSKRKIKLPWRPRPIPPIPSSMTWLGLSIVNLLRSINRTETENEK